MISKVVSNQSARQGRSDNPVRDGKDNSKDGLDRAWNLKLIQDRGVLDVMKRDRFELLSAYLDGELSADERRQVQNWLDHDPAVKRLYCRLLRLRQGMQTLPNPRSEQPVEEVIRQVFTRLGRVPQRALLWGGSAAAALVVSILMGTGQSEIPTLAGFGSEANQSPSSPSEFEPEFEIAEGPFMEGTPTLSDRSDPPLQIALDQPVIDIPKAAISSAD